LGRHVHQPCVEGGRRMARKAAANFCASESKKRAEGGRGPRLCVRLPGPESPWQSTVEYCAAEQNSMVVRDTVLQGGLLTRWRKRTTWRLGSQHPQQATGAGRTGARGQRGSFDARHQVGRREEAVTGGGEEGRSIRGCRAAPTRSGQDFDGRQARMRDALEIGKSGEDGRDGQSMLAGARVDTVAAARRHGAIGTKEPKTRRGSGNRFESRTISQNSQLNHLSQPEPSIHSSCGAGLEQAIHSGMYCVQMAFHRSKTLHGIATIGTHQVLINLDMRQPRSLPSRRLKWRCICPALKT
jgi:hypothetical protein